MYARLANREAENLVADSFCGKKLKGEGPKGEDPPLILIPSFFTTP